jgi:septal ring-binding cell division protein DamX
MQDTEVVGIAETPAPPTPTPAAATAATVPATAPTSVIDTWQDHNYVIQLIAARKLESLKQTFATVDSDKTPVTQFTLTNSGKPMYVLVTGAFTSYSKAKYAVKALPTNALRNNAWIRKVSDIRVDMEDTK